MSWPVRNLPVIQNWDCHGCGECCREYEVHVTAAERQRILAQGWQNDPAIGNAPLFVRSGPWWRRKWRLNTRPADDACVFLNEQGRCRIHAKFGGPAKPLACRVYPFTLTPAGDHWRIGIRFACPSVTDNLGRPVSAHRDDLRKYGQGLEEREGVNVGRGVAPPPLRTGQHVPWSDVGRFAAAILGVLGRTNEPLEFRLRQCLALAAVCRLARFDKVTGNRLDEFLELVTQGCSDIERDAGAIGPPSWIGRILFRQVVAVYARRDFGPRQGISKNGRLALIWAAWRFARGTGRVPQTHAFMPEGTFEQLEQPAGPLSDVSAGLLDRYYRVKVESYQFFGPTNFNAGFWEGLESLMLTFPATMWLSRLFRDRPRDQAISQALRIVDDNFGYNRLLGLRRQRVSTRILAARGELSKLIAWYSR